MIHHLAVLADVEADAGIRSGQQAVVGKAADLVRVLNRPTIVAAIGPLCAAAAEP